jgi:cytochrome c oxidase subunit 2
VNKLWSLVFLPVPILCVVLFAISPGNGWWLPENVSTYGSRVDHLFNVILAIVTVAFIGTEGILIYCLFKYADHGKRGLFVHTNHTLEFWWTLIPALILVFIAVYQFKTWSDIKVQGKFPADVAQKLSADAADAEVLAGQFEWRIRYPGKDGKIGTLDDVISLNELHVPVNTNFVLRLRSRDVLHSFFLPNFRVKQDAVPGMTIPVWFQGTKEGAFDLFCAELCGWGHYKMRGRIIVQSKDSYDAWLKDAYEEQERDLVADATPVAKTQTEVSK